MGDVPTWHPDEKKISLVRLVAFPASTGIGAAWAAVVQVRLSMTWTAVARNMTSAMNVMGIFPASVTNDF